MRRIGLLFHPRVPEAHALAQALERRALAQGAVATVVSAWDESLVADVVADGTDLMVTLGGDGTVLRVARAAAAARIPIFGVNFGRLGYLAEVVPVEAEAAFQRLLAGEGRVETRLMLQAFIHDGLRRLGPLAAVNDVFVGRGRVARAVRLSISIDGALLARVACDGTVVASPVGSTAYSLSAGGPIVVPSLDALVVTPVVPHPTAFPPLVLSRDCKVELVVGADDEATVTLDGQIHYTVTDGTVVRVEAAAERTRFLRLEGPLLDYSTLMRRLHP